MQAYELPATVTADGYLVLPNFQLNLRQNTQVRVIVLVEEVETDDIQEADWLHSAAQNSAFDFLSDPEEDIYNVGDGKPFQFQG
ncbi:MAG: hypothetical protein F6K04_10420 [Leptolyngbya sp. SIO4C5]|uniref:hypothetical protein n=1 Tax=Sphaerothrix gracilis TaxID=3151835 RepID=UPI0013C1A5D8|nr:hypothetical protein [Leptolyngbya sp. SIO4C5]